MRIASFIMSGGIGSRLWPLSREDNPKQFHDLSGEGSMLVKTVKRLQGRTTGETPIFLIASERHADRIRADLASMDLGGGETIYEPLGRNTAAAVAVAAIATLERYGDGLVLVVPSDHEIATVDQFWATVDDGLDAASNGRLVVFGIPPTHPETGYGYIEVGAGADSLFDVARFVEKPNLPTAQDYCAAGTFFWNAGIFLFRASAMRDALLQYAPDVWHGAKIAYDEGAANISGRYLPLEAYSNIPSISIDYAVMEHASDIAMVPARFRWNDLGSWQSLLEITPTDKDGNVIRGDVVAIDCANSYIRSEGRLLSAIGLRDVAVVATADATFIAPVARSQNVKQIVERLEATGRLETKFTPAQDRAVTPGAWRRRVRHWLFEEALPLWSTAGVDRRYGGFHEALAFDGGAVGKPKRTRTMARQIYAFAVAKSHGWDGPAEEMISHGIEFVATRARTSSGGWARTLDPEGGVLDPTEDSYDHSCMLLALAKAHSVGNSDALRLGTETFNFLDERLEDPKLTGFLETAGGAGERRSNPHMHLLEAFLAWHAATGDRSYLRRASRIIDLFRNYFFDAETWTLGEFFDEDWKSADGEKGLWTEPGHHFEWASLLVDFANRTGQRELVRFARKLYASAVANGLNRSTGLAYGAVSRDGIVLDNVSRSWPQAEAIKAAIALDAAGGPDLKPEIEERVRRLFRWHIDSAPTGLWIDSLSEKGSQLSRDVPASIFYHIVFALTEYLDIAGQDKQTT